MPDTLQALVMEETRYLQLQKAGFSLVCYFQQGVVPILDM